MSFIVTTGVSSSQSFSHSFVSLLREEEQIYYQGSEKPNSKYPSRFCLEIRTAVWRGFFIVTSIQRVSHSVTHLIGIWLMSMDKHRLCNPISMTIPGNDNKKVTLFAPIFI